MNDQTRESTGGSQLDSDIAALVRSVRRQTVAIWVLVGLLALGFGVPWLKYFRFKLAQPAAAHQVATQGTELEPEPAFDNEFYARPLEEKIARATVILLTRLEKTGERHREVVAEIIKQKPGVRLYYKVGDEYEPLSHAPTPSCQDCEGQGQVVFMLGNPASMVYSFTYEGERLEMGGMPITELRRQAAESLGKQ
ncbi:MAG: hypothetical protein U0X73_05735 [Thermoanaerobaculia bacterium]